MPKVNIIDTFPVLAELIRTSSHPFNPNIIQGVSTDAGTSLPVVQLSVSSRILSSLLSFIIPVAPHLPLTAVEDTMELLSAAQKYEMDLILTNIRDHLARQNPPLIREENVTRSYGDTLRIRRTCVTLRQCMRMTWLLRWMGLRPSSR